jgi:mRNA interferase YafQ
MKDIIQSNRFKRDYKLAAKRRLNMERLHNILRLLATDTSLPERCNPHKLKGEYFGYWECHVEPDWLLIYKIDAEYIELVATGTHADLFR